MRWSDFQMHIIRCSFCCSRLHTHTSKTPTLTQRVHFSASSSSTTAQRLNHFSSLYDLSAFYHLVLLYSMSSFFTWFYGFILLSAGPCCVVHWQHWQWHCRKNRITCSVPFPFPSPWTMNRFGDTKANSLMTIIQQLTRKRLTLTFHLVIRIRTQKSKNSSTKKTFIHT